MYEYVVIGNGMIGSAAARYLSEQSGSVCLIGPGEPANWDAHEGVFASHYDSGRITRVLDAKLPWAQMAQRSITQYRGIERRSGINFYHPSGCITVGTSDYVGANVIAGKTLGVSFKTYASEDIPADTGFRFRAGFDAVYERGAAGHISPRNLVAAQGKVAELQGATLVRDTVTGIDVGANGVVAQTEGGQRIEGKRVLVAAGSYGEILLPGVVKLNVIPRTIVMARLDSAETARLSAMPSAIYHPDEPDFPIDGFYSNPPTLYPDGNTYFKIGGDKIPDELPKTHQDIVDWFHSGGSKFGAETLIDMMHSVIPDFRVEETLWKPCTTTYTPSGMPYVDAVEEGRLYVALGGNGAAAKSSDEIGRLGALVTLGEWDNTYNREDFRIANE